MFDFQSKKKLININFTTKKRWSFRFTLIALKQKLKSKELILALLSGFGFISLFVENYLASSLIEAKKEKIQKLRRELLFKDIEIKRTERLLELSYKEFTKFYIPTLKEKIFYIWYHEQVIPKIWDAVNKFSKLINTSSPFIGFVAYPNIYYLKNSWGYKYYLPTKVHKIQYERIEVNPFLKEKKINRNFVLYIEPFKIDRNFERNISEIKDKNIKANLLLEYGLMKYGLNPSKIHTPVTLIFPVNIVVASAKIYKSKLKELKEFCDNLIINKEYKKEIFFRNSLQIEASLDAICIKQIY